jgi:hypothetical protein
MKASQMLKKNAYKIGTVRDERKRSLMRDHEENDIGNKKRETLMREFQYEI